MNRREIERKTRIDSIRVALEDVKNSGKEVNERRFLVIICNDYGVSMRTAKEYLEVAQLDETL